MPEDQRYIDDNYYRKGQFAIKFSLDEQEAELDEEARYRALQLMLYAIRDEVGMKPSSFVDVYEEEDEDGEVYTVGEFLIYNKLGVTSLGKLKRFMDDHLVGDTNARVLLIDPKTEARFEATEFTIQYLFHDFIAGKHKGNWEDLKSFLKQEDKGYAALTQKKTATMLHYNNHLYTAAAYPLKVDELRDAITESYSLPELTGVIKQLWGHYAYKDAHSDRSLPGFNAIRHMSVDEALAELYELRDQGKAVDAVLLDLLRLALDQWEYLEGEYAAEGEESFDNY